MVDNTVENKSGPQNIEQEIGQKVAAQSAEQLKEEFKNLKEWAASEKTLIEADVKIGKFSHEFTGDKKDTGTERGRANSITELVQKMLFAAKNAPEKVPSAAQHSDPNTPIPTPESTKLLQKFREKVKLDRVNDTNAPYFYDLLESITNGKITSSEALAQEVQKIKLLETIDSSMYKNIQEASLEYATNTFKTPEPEAKKMLGVEVDPNSQKKVQEGAEADSNFKSMWAQYFSSFFSIGAESKLIESLYSTEKFVSYYKGVQDEMAKEYTDLNPIEVSKKASTEMEVRIALLFGRLYSRLDHESPKEYFQSIEQQDIMRGITPVKLELKRRIEHLSHDLHNYEVAKDVKFYRRLEWDPETIAIDAGKGNLKARPRFKTTLEPTESNGGDFAHYLDQIVEHYIEARSYTHNSRAIFLHAPDPQKGFYGQLASFAAEKTSLDFDQMMLLPDNDIFQSAFGLYNKMIEEGFAKFDWKHTAGMFTTSINENLTPMERRILTQLKVMYSDRKEITEDRLAAALTMAVGASRGMFLTEVEMAAHADPHINEKGGATFTSYYNQDATPLMAFNPQHALYRFHGGPNLLDPIFFLPVESFKGSQSFSDHNKLWEKAKLYKDSFLKGREALKGETTFFDMLDNIGLVGGPMQRKGWRTEWQLNSIYITDPITIEEKGKPPKVHQKVNHVKTFKYFENIGYELLQDYVTKLEKDFSKARSTVGMGKDVARLVGQKKELFGYIFKEYFDKDPKDLGKYLDGIRDVKMKDMLTKVRRGEAAPDDIDDEVETQVSKAFLDRMLARVIMKRLPSKILRMDRDRLSEKGTSRYKQVMIDMKLEGQFDVFDNIMQDMILAEQMMRKNVSKEMCKMRDANKPGEEYGSIEYKMTPDSIKALFGPLIEKGMMTEERLNKVLLLFDHIQKKYGPDSKTFDFDKELVPYFKNGGAIDRKSKYTVALDETDLSFIPFRGGGGSVLKRSIGDIASVEENVSKPIGELVKKLRDMAINGKRDFDPIIEIIGKVYGAMDSIIGIPYAHELASKLAAMTIMYMKKDTQARALYGIFGVGRYNSMAAESCGKKVGVWEWDSSDIDKFIFALEARRLVPGTPYSLGQDGTAREPVYVSVPFVKEPVKLPDKIETSKLALLFGGKNGKFKFLGLGKEITIPNIPLFSRRTRDFTAWTSKDLRNKFGGRKFDMIFDIINKYLPAALIFILFSQLKKALEEFEGKKK